ncbi:RRP15-like protein [Aphelenchoides fujianensis]|nr:RRP15-like protein [Aphelenchoides fujianensis]
MALNATLESDIKTEESSAGSDSENEVQATANEAKGVYINSSDDSSLSSDEDEKPDVKSQVSKRRKLMDQLAAAKIGLKKPNYAADREKERSLSRIATKGVTQLFNAVSERQKLIDAKLKEMEAAKTRTKRRGIVEDLKSNDFHSQLYKKLRPIPAEKEVKTEDEEEDEGPEKMEDDDEEE